MDHNLSKVIKAIEYQLGVSLEEEEEDIIECIKSQLEELGYTSDKVDPDHLNIHGVYSIMEVYCSMITDNSTSMYRNLTADQKVIYHIMEKQNIMDIYWDKAEQTGGVCYSLVEFEYDDDKYIVELD